MPKCSKIALTSSAAVGSHGRLIALATAALVVISVMGAGSASAAANTLLQGAFSGDAYGTVASANVTSAGIALGKTANLSCPCQGTDGKTLTNTVSSVAVTGILSTGAVTSTTFASRTTTTAQVRDTSTIANLRLLGGLITADEVKAVAALSATAGTITSSADESGFVNLRINGQPIAAKVKQNTTIALPGVGTVLLNRVRKDGNGTSAGTLLVEMLYVTVTQANVLGLPVGAKIVLAHALSGFTRAQPEAIVGGQAYAAQANATIGGATQAKIGKAAQVFFGCAGTNGQTIAGSVGALNVAKVLSFGAGQTTAFGGPDDSGTVAHTTATITDLNALNGLITAKTIKAVAYEMVAKGQRTRSATGSSFIGLKVAGIPVTANVAPNTRLTIPGVGTVTVNEQVFQTGSGGKTQANGLRIVVTKTNLLGLPVGSEIVVAHADASAQPF